MKKFAGQAWHISEPRLEQTETGHRVSAEIEGDTVWIESDDVPLVPVPEAFAAMMFVPALLGGARFRIDADLDADFVEQTRAVPALLHDWWGCSTEYPLVDLSVSHESPAEPNDFRAQCFTGGVDSVYAFLQDRDEIDALFFVHGFDIALDDSARIEAFEASLREVAQQSGKQAMFLRCNVRQHKVFGKFRWLKTQSAAIAACGHVASGSIGKLRIPSSWSYKDPRPWGSHWDLDPLWSSSRIQIEHADATYSRYEKIKLISEEPLAHEHLRVCWENLASTINCGRCTKCLRTMLALRTYGVLQEFKTFEADVNFAERLDAIPYMYAYEKELVLARMGDFDDPEIRAAMERLLKRDPKWRFSPAWKSFLRKVGLRK